MTTGPAEPQPVVAPTGPPPYRRLSPLTPLVRSAVLVVAVLFSSWDDLLRRDIGPVAWGLLGLLVAGGVYGAASWLRTKYWIEADELRVDTGLVSRQSRRIRVDRLQGIDIAQPFVARLLGLAELRMDVAGGGSKEGSLAFLRLRDAQELRETLLARRDAVRSDAAGPPAGTPDGIPTVGAEPDGGVPEPGLPAAAGGAPPAALRPDRLPEQRLAKLDLGTLLVSLLLSPTTVLFAIAALAMLVVFVMTGQIAGAAGVLPVVAGFVLTQFRRLSAYYDFTLSASRDGTALQVRRGLFERSSQTVNLERVQGVVVTEPFMWRGFGWARLDVAVAGTASPDGDGSPAASTVMPVASRAEVLALARRALAATGGADPDAVRLSAPPARARWVAPVGRRGLRAGVGEHLVVTRHGVLTRRTHVVPHARVQSLHVVQGPVQRRLGLADVRVDSPPGPVRVRARHREAAEARTLLEQEVARAAAARGSASVALRGGTTREDPHGTTPVVPVD